MTAWFPGAGLLAVLARWYLRRSLAKLDVCILVC
jgi:hypothetical protein